MLDWITGDILRNARNVTDTAVLTVAFVSGIIGNADAAIAGVALFLLGQVADYTIKEW